MQNSKMIEIIKKIAYKESLYDVYSDFVEISALVISNTCDFTNKDKREKRYKKLIEKYGKTANLFQKLFAELVETMDKGFNDVLGSLYMELELGNKNTGQFFTPYHLAQAAAKMILAKAENQIKGKGFISLYEPSVGGGAMVIAIAEEMLNKGYNPQTQLVIECNDIDLKGVYMSYVQLSLLGIPAVVKHANSLNLEVFDTFKTPMYFLGMWEHRERGVCCG